MARDKEYSHAARMVCLRQMLHDESFVTVVRLRDEFGICRKTVYNDIAALEEAGVQIERDKGPAGEVRWRLRRKAKTVNITLGPGQVVPFGMALQALSFLEGTEVHDQIGEVMKRLVAGANTKTQKQLASLDRKVAIVPHGPKCYREKDEVLDDILTAMVHDNLLEIRYSPSSSGGKQKDHLVEPLTLVQYREALYLIAHSRTYNRRIRFAVDRITSARWQKGESFDYPQDYDPKDVLDGAFGMMRDETKEDVAIVFEADQARYVMERNWHPTQEFEEYADGRVRMTMQVSGIQDVLLWLVGHTGTFEVLSPPSLREMVQDRLRNATEAHRRKKKAKA